LPKRPTKETYILQRDLLIVATPYHLLALPKCIALHYIKHWWISLQQTLQRTATHCNTLHRHTVCIALHYMHLWICLQHTLQHTASYCNTLQHTAIHFNTLHDSTCICGYLCNTLQHTATHCNTLQHTARVVSLGDQHIQNRRDSTCHVTPTNSLPHPRTCCIPVVALDVTHM